MRQILEWAPFRLRAGVGEDELMAASAQLQSAFVSRQPGFLDRRLARMPDGGYVDLVLWASREAAEQAMQAAADSSVCSTFFALMAPGDDEAGAGVLHFEVLAAYAGERS